MAAGPALPSGASASDGRPTAADLLQAGLRQENLGALEQAATLYREALALDATLVEAHVDLAGLLWRLEDFDGALAHAQEAVRLAPQQALAQRVLGSVLMNLNRVADAEARLRRALELQPALPSAQLDLAFTLLLAGRLQEGWAAYGSRWRDPRLQAPASWRAGREWPGLSVPLAGQSIGVYAEQGRGDILQFLRYVPKLQELGAQVACIVPPDLAPLVQASFADVPCLPGEGGLPVQWHVAVMDLPGRFGTTLQDIPADVPYLRAPEAARRRWRARLQPWAGVRKVGLAWCGSPAQVNNRNRSMHLTAMLPLAQVPGLQFFSLQKEEAGGWTDAPLDPLVDLTADWHDLADSAAMIEQLDLVITVDSAIAHFAGALGKPAWILLAPNADWRWLLERTDSPWYPRTRLFRRGFGQPRAAQVDGVAQALREWSAGRPQ